MKARLGTLVAAFVALATVQGLAGCAADACTTVGWSNVLKVKLTGETAALAMVQVCVAGDCAQIADGSRAEAPGPQRFELDLFDQREANVWPFDAGMTQPKRVTVLVLGPGGEVRSDTEVTPEWERVGGDERCGGPAEATVTVRP
ncbi:hypothetical protein ACFSWE_07020 [Leucobacter albus]|uniref:Secreted protein n=1 Tax=Leucobacter albus TaxID=272210 RepID=A0ABW3TIP6_9MICO